MNPPDPAPNDTPDPNPQNTDGNSSKDDASKDTAKSQKGASSPPAQGDSHLPPGSTTIGAAHSETKRKPINTAEEVRQTIRGKVRQAAANLRPGFGSDAIAQAVDSLVEEKARELMKAATNYLKHSAKACKIDKEDLAKIIIKSLGYKIQTKSPRKSGTKTGFPKASKRDSKRNKKGGSDGK